MMLILLLSVYLVAADGSYHDADWIDPTDMLNYDAASGKMRNQQQAHEEEPLVNKVLQEAVETVCPAQKDACEKRIELLTQQVSDCKANEKSKGSHKNTGPIFRRYLNRIMNEAQQLGLPDKSNSEIHYDAEVVLTRQMLTEIQRFLTDADWNVGALDEALSKTLVNFKQHNIEEWRWKFEDYFGIDSFTAFMALLCILCVVSVIATEIWTRIGWITQIKRLCILSIVISFGWNWLYLYKVAFAERQAEVAKLGRFDSSCSEKISWSDSLIDFIKGSVTFQNDPCEEYFKTVIINPALMVPPTKALALTFTDFITEPLKHVGKGIGEFLKALLSEIPVLLQIPVLIFMAVALLGLCYGTGRSVGQFNRIQNFPDHERKRPQPVEGRQTYNELNEEMNNQHHQQANTPQLQQREWGTANEQRVLSQRPETLHAMDMTDHRMNQEQLANVSDPDFLSEERDDSLRHGTKVVEQFARKECRKIIQYSTGGDPNSESTAISQEQRGAAVHTLGRKVSVSTIPHDSEEDFEDKQKNLKGDCQSHKKSEEVLISNSNSPSIMNSVDF